MLLFELNLLHEPIALKSKGPISVAEVQKEFGKIVARNRGLVKSLVCENVSFTKSTGKSHIYFTIDFTSADPSSKLVKSLYENEIYGAIKRLAQMHGGFSKEIKPKVGEFTYGSLFKEVLFMLPPTGDQDGMPGEKIPKRSDYVDAAFYLGKQPKIKKVPQREGF